MTTPSHRPAALVIAESLLVSTAKQRASKEAATALLNDLANSGWCLIPWAELEGAANWIEVECDHLLSEGHPKQLAALEMVAVLRQRSRG